MERTTHGFMRIRQLLQSIFTRVLIVAVVAYITFLGLELQDLHISAIHFLKLLLAQSAIILIVIHAFYERFAITVRRGLLDGVTLVLACLCAAAFYDFGHYYAKNYDHVYINRHDFFHYYMGSKYSPEIGYLHLYPAALIVDDENGRRFKNRTIRDQTDYSFTPVSEILETRETYKNLFSEERWKEFEADVLFMRQLMGAKRWQKALRDKGYNATPVWDMVAGRLTNALPLENTVARNALLGLDMGMIVVMFGCVWWAFGWRTMLFTVIFWGINYMMNQTHIKGSLLRLDWVCLLVIGTCLLKKERYKSSGAVLAYAAMMRIFPVVFAFGLGVKMLFEYYRTRKLSRRYIEFFVVFALVAGVLLGGSVVSNGGLEKWTLYQELIRMHNDDIVGMRTGFKYVFLNAYKVGDEGLPAYKANKKREFDDRAVQWWLIQVAVIAAAAFAMRRLEDYETVAFGFVLAYFLVAPTFYYYVMLIVPLFLFLPKLGEPSRAFGAALMFAMSLLGYVMFLQMGSPRNLGFTAFFWNSVMYLGLALFMFYIAISKRRIDENEGESPPLAG